MSFFFVFRVLLFCLSCVVELYIPGTVPPRPRAARPGVALRLPELVHHHCAGGVAVPKAILHGALCQLRVRWCVPDGAAHVLPGALHLAIPCQSLWREVVRRSLLCCSPVYLSQVWYFSLFS